jgi:hypothetical protein
VAELEKMRQQHLWRELLVEERRSRIEEVLQKVSRETENFYVRGPSLDAVGRLLTFLRRGEFYFVWIRIWEALWINSG